MAEKKKQDQKEYVKKNTFYLVSFLALFVGFLGGVVFGVFRAGSNNPGQPATAGPPANVSQSTMVLSLEKEVLSNPTNVNAWIELGNKYFDTNQYEKSIRAYQRALDLDPNNANVWTDIGIMYRRSGNPMEAIRSFDKAIEVDPQHEISLMNKGIVLLHDLGDEKGAIRAWEELLKINPLAVSPTGQSVAQMIGRLKNETLQPGASKNPGS